MNNLFSEFDKLDIGKYVIRKIHLDDCEDIFSIYGDKEVMKYDIENIVKSIDEAKENIKMIHKGIENKWFVRWAVVEKNSNKLIGTIALHHFEFGNNRVQIGYNLKRNYWKKGIMNEVLKSTIDYLSYNRSLKEIEASINTKNIDSMKLAEKVGFKLYKKIDADTVIFKKLLK